jgi:hypothetical protein
MELTSSERARLMDLIKSCRKNREFPRCLERDQRAEQRGRVPWNLRKDQKAMRDTQRGACSPWLALKNMN